MAKVALRSNEREFIQTEEELVEDLENIYLKLLKASSLTPQNDSKRCEEKGRGSTKEQIQ